LVAPSVFTAAAAAVAEVFGAFEDAVPRLVVVRERVCENAAVDSRRIQIGTISFFIMRSFESQMSFAFQPAALTECESSRIVPVSPTVFRVPTSVGSSRTGKSPTEVGTLYAVCSRSEIDREAVTIFRNNDL
jgi:hypothetical protein